MTRDALLFSDGSMTVFAEGWSMEKIEAERVTADKNAPRSAWTRIARVNVEVVEVTYDPTVEVPVAMTEVEQLRAENDELRAKLAVASQGCPA
jgi:hypothetical protein